MKIKDKLVLVDIKCQSDAKRLMFSPRDSGMFSHSDIQLKMCAILSTTRKKRDCWLFAGNIRY